MISHFKIISPNTQKEFEEYFYFRWVNLRKEFNQKFGSEKDELENKSEHRMIIGHNNKILGVGRIQLLNENQSQVRYFAIEETFRKIGLGKYLMKDLEKIAINNNSNCIILNAREGAIEFYKKIGYKIVKKTNLLFGKIQHYQMAKKII